MTRTWCLLAAVLAFSPLPCAAQTASEKATAETLFETGRKLLQEGKHAEACPKFEASQRLDSGLGTLLYLGECYEKMGKLASAWATFREAESVARGRGEQDRAAVARQRAMTLEPRLSKLEVAVSPGNPADLMVKSDGNVVPRESWGIALPVDPGDHAIEATASGKRNWSGSVKIDGEGSTGKIMIPVLEDAPAAAVAGPSESPAATAGPTDPTADTAPAADAADGGGQRIAGLIVGVVGIGGIAVGSVFGLQASSKNDDSKDECPNDPNLCTPKGKALRDDAQDAALISTITFGVGAAALATGAILFFTAPSGEKTATSRALRVGGMLGPDGASATLGGRF